MCPKYQECGTEIPLLQGFGYHYGILFTTFLRAYGIENRQQTRRTSSQQSYEAVLVKTYTTPILIAIIAAALFIRIILIQVNIQRHPDFFSPSHADIHRKLLAPDQPYMNPFGYEIANVAHALVCTHEGFASPFGGATGTTGWVAPGIVLLYALSFKLFGCFTQQALLCLFGLAIIFSTVIIVLVYKTTLMIFNSPAAALCSAFAFALCPQDLWIMLSPHQTDFNVYAVWFVLVFFLFLQWVKTQSAQHLCLFSVAAACSLLFNPVMILPTLMCLGFYALRARTTTGLWWRHVLLTTCIIVVSVSPYILYQKQRLGCWTFIKTNGPFEVYLGNRPDFDGVLVYDLFQMHHPGSNLKEYTAYRTLGEVNYIRTKFVEFIDHFDPVFFISLSIKRFFYFFFILKPYIAPERFHTGRLVAEYISYSLPGLALLLYLLLRHNSLTWEDAALFLYIMSYALPYLCAGIMYRYSMPISTLASVCVGKLLYSAITQKKSFAHA